MSNPNPEWTEWEKRACEHCAKGICRWECGEKGSIHFKGVEVLPCTAPTPEQYIEQLEKRIKELEAKAAQTPEAVQLLATILDRCKLGTCGGERIEALLIECKRRGGRLRKSQKEWHAEAERRGFRVLVIDDVEQLEKELGL